MACCASSRGTARHHSALLFDESSRCRRNVSCFTVALAIGVKAIARGLDAWNAWKRAPTLQQPRRGPLVMQAHRCQRCNTHEKRVLQRDINAAMVGAPWHSWPTCSTAHVSERRQRASQRLSAAGACPPGCGASVCCLGPLAVSACAVPCVCTSPNPRLCGRSGLFVKRTRM